MNSGYLLRNGTVVGDEKWFPADVRILGCTIVEIGSGLKKKKTETEIDCSRYLIFPGLINSHDHLEFNLFPRLGEPPYRNAYEWGNDLHRRWKPAIEAVQKIPLKQRLWWGSWKNLFSGVTTVVHHNQYYSKFRARYPLSVLRDYSFAHSLQFDSNIHAALKKRRKGTPFIIHLAEGIDKTAQEEVSALQNLGGLDERTIAVHCVGLKRGDVETIREKKASVVWCPSSNMYLFGKTARIQELLQGVPVAIGTDSTLTGSVTLFDELRLAKTESRLSPQQLFKLVTDAPRNIFNLPFHAGRIIGRGVADLFLISANGKDPYESLLQAEPSDIALLFQKGQVRIFESQLIDPRRQRYHQRITIMGRQKLINDSEFPRFYKTLKPFLSHYTYLKSDRT
ncbi:MAG: amidohydrolase family protein [Ignavibacteriales bacterium]|nr:amidohydrolase family protein [Ignavibacteriales bacterium]